MPDGELKNHKELIVKAINEDSISEVGHLIVRQVPSNAHEAIKESLAADDDLLICTDIENGKSLLRLSLEKKIWLDSHSLLEKSAFEYKEDENKILEFLFRVQVDPFIVDDTGISPLRYLMLLAAYPKDNLMPEGDSGPSKKKKKVLNYSSKKAKIYVAKFLEYLNSDEFYNSYRSPMSNSSALTSEMQIVESLFTHVIEYCVNYLGGYIEKSKFSRLIRLIGRNFHERVQSTEKLFIKIKEAMQTGNPRIATDAYIDLASRSKRRKGFLYSKLKEVQEFNSSFDSARFHKKRDRILVEINSAQLLSELSEVRDVGQRQKETIQHLEAASKVLISKIKSQSGASFQSPSSEKPSEEVDVDSGKKQEQSATSVLEYIGSFIPKMGRRHHENEATAMSNLVDREDGSENGEAAEEVSSDTEKGLS